MNLDCRASQRCNAECFSDNYGQRHCHTPVGQDRVSCSHTQVCYPEKGQCGPSCIPTGSAPEEAATSCSNAAAFNFTVGNACNTNDGMCYNCLSDADCNSSKNATCGSVCSIVSGQKNVCTSVTGCGANENCVSKSTTFSCMRTSISTIIVPSLFLLYVIMLFN